MTEPRHEGRNWCASKAYGLAALMAAGLIAIAGCGSADHQATERDTVAPTETGESPAASPTSPAASPTETEASCTKPCADSGGWIAEVKNFKYDVKSDNEFIQPESGNVFVTMEVTFINKSGSSHSASPFDFKLEADGVERDAEFVGPCEQWSPVDVSAHASYGPKCLAFQAKSGHRSGITLTWNPGLTGTYDIPVS